MTSKSRFFFSIFESVTWSKVFDLVTRKWKNESLPINSKWNFIFLPSVSNLKWNSKVEKEKFNLGVSKSKWDLMLFEFESVTRKKEFILKCSSY